MDCNKANEFMMRFMDNLLNEFDAKKLGDHLAECKMCKEDFIVYDQMMNEFKSSELFDAPDGFEDCIMQKIKELPPLHIKVNNSIDNIIYWVMGIFSVFLGIGFILSMYKDTIMGYVASEPQFAWLSQVLTGISGYVNRFTVNLIDITNTFAVTVSGYISSSRYVLLVIFIVLLGVQYLVYRKDKVEV